MVEKFTEFSKETGHTPSQIVLAWIMSQGDDFIPIPGTTNVTRLEENLGSLKVTLSESHKNKIREIIKSIEVCGERYNEANMKKLNI